MKNWFFVLSVHLFRLLLFWLLFFLLMRGGFLSYYYQLLSHDEIHFAEVLRTFLYAFQLDLSTACYLLLFPLVLRTVLAFTKSIQADHIELWYTSLVINIYTLITLAEVGLYGEWKTKLSYKALTYLANPTEVYNSVTTAQFFTLISLWLLISFGAYFSVKQWAFGRKAFPKAKIQSILTSFVVVLFVVFTGIRGGWSAIPITTSSAWFSHHEVLNAAAVNPAYNLMMSTLDAYTFNDQRLFRFMSDDEAKQMVKQIHEIRKDSTLSLLKFKKPNIVVLLLESWSADMVESLGGEAGITPEFKKLERDGLLFTDFYASGNRSQQAMGSLYAGIPALPLTTITNHPEKYPALPSLVKVLKNNGYYTSFYFGGELMYGNILSFLMSNNFDEILEDKDLDPKLQRGKLGVHDEYMFEWLPAKLSRLKQPFFTTLFTLSSHSPYDFPAEHKLQWPVLEKDFVNSVAYTDKGLGTFFTLAKRESWYDSTLFVLMADHSHNTYRNHELKSFPYHKIPLLLCGPALKDSLRGTQYTKIAGNTDVTATLLRQLGLPDDDFFWSKDLMNTGYQPFAYFELNDGFGWKRPDGELVWNILTNKAHIDSMPPALKDSLSREGKAYLQQWYGEFLRY